MSLDLHPDIRRLGRSVLDGALQFRSRAVKAVLWFIGVFIVLTPFSERLFEAFAQPIMQRLPAGSQMIAKQIASPFLTPLAATLWISLFISMPAILYQIWRLVDSWLPERGRRIALPFVIASALLFYVGVAFAYFGVLPMAFAFFTRVAPKGVVVMTDISAYLDFTIGMCLGFGFAFQVPIAIIILVWTGVVERRTLAKARPYVFLGAFVVGMILTPPDVISQTLLALPMYALYEGALLFCARFLPQRN